MLTILKDFYNTSKHISLHYAIGPKVIHEGVRLYFFFKWPE